MWAKQGHSIYFLTTMSCLNPYLYNYWTTAGVTWEFLFWDKQKLIASIRPFSIEPQLFIKSRYHQFTRAVLLCLFYCIFA